MVRKYYRKPRTKSYITYDDLEQLGFGSWLKKNAGAVGTVLGATVGTLIAPGVGTALGASIGGSLGGAVSANEADKEATEAQNKMVAAQNAQAAAQAEFQRQQNSLSIKTFPPVMANGGDITKPKPEEPEDKNLLNPKLWGQRYDSIELDTLPKATIIGDYVGGNYRVIVSLKNKDELNLKNKKPVVVREAENIPVYKVKQGKRVYYVPTQDAALTHALPSQIKYNNVINYLGTKYRTSFPEVAEVINTLAKKYIDKFGYDEFITNKKEDFLRDVDALFSSNDKAVLLGNNAVLNKEDAAQLFKDNNLSDEDVKTLMGTLKTKGRGADDKDNESLYEFGYRTYANSLFRKPMSLGPIVLDSYNPYDDSERLLAGSYYLNYFYPPYLVMDPVDVGESTDSNDFTKQYRLSPNSIRKTKSYDETHFMPNFSADDIFNLSIPFKTNSAISGLVVNNDVRAAFPDYYANDSEKGTVVNYLNNKINEQFKSIPRNQMDLNSSINHPKDVELFDRRINLMNQTFQQLYPQRAFGGQINLEDEMQNTMRNTGVINYSGQTHEGPDEGIPVDAMGNPSQVSQQEPAALVEDGEVAYIMPGNGTYVFSDKLKYDGKKTFADKAKEIQRKYKLRMKDGKIVDPISEVGYNKEMTRLVEAQEAFREVSGVNKEEAIKEQFAEMGLPIENNTLPIGKDGIYIKPSKRGTFTAAAKKHGMGVQEFARHVLANKENYSASMVKKANFARNAAKWKHEYGGFADSGLPKYGGGSIMSTTIGLGEAFLPAAASTIGNMWLMNQIKNRKVEKLKYTPMAAKQIDLSAERNATTENLRAMEAQNRRNALLTGSSAGQINQNSLLGTLQTERALAEALSKSYGNEAQFNATAQNQINAINAENQLKADMANLEMKRQRDATLDALRSQIASSWAQGAATYLQGKRDFAALNMQADDYKIENKGNWFFSNIQKSPVVTGSTDSTYDDQSWKDIIKKREDQLWKDMLGKIEDITIPLDPYPDIFDGYTPMTPTLLDPRTGKRLLRPYE